MMVHLNIEVTLGSCIYIPTPHHSAFAENLLGTLLQELFSEPLYELYDWSFYFISHIVFHQKVHSVKKPNQAQKTYENVFQALKTRPQKFK